MPRRYLVIPAGLIAGALLGLVLAWKLWAPPPLASTIAQLPREERLLYVRLVAAAFAEERDLRAARDRLAALGAGNTPQWVAELAFQDAAAGRTGDARRMARLAYALGVSDPAIVSLAALPTSAPEPGPNE